MIQTEVDFTKAHGRENNSESDDIYVDSLDALNNNCRIIMIELLKGRVLTGMDIVKLGCLEYRKRLDDLKKIYNIPVQDKVVEGKRYKCWWLEKDYIESLKVSL